MIYRVTVKTTGSLQPSQTFWNKEVVYCGDDLKQARIVYLRELQGDYGGSYGMRSRDTIIEGFEEEPENIDDTETVEVET